LRPTVPVSGLRKCEPEAVEFMQERGYDLSRHASKSLSTVPDVEYDFAITMGCGDECPLVPPNTGRIGKSPIQGNVAGGFSAGARLIESRVKSLLASIQAA